MTEFEWWPEYNSGPLWDNGTSVSPHSLLSAELADRVVTWNANFTEDRLPTEGPGDRLWLAEGKSLLDAVRVELAGTHTVVVTEPWWGEKAN